MESSERGELNEMETDEQLRQVVEQAVNGQVQVGRGIGERMDDGEGGVRVREGEEEGKQGKRLKELPGR